MTAARSALLVLTLLSAMVPIAARADAGPNRLPAMRSSIPQNARTRIVTGYLDALQSGAFDRAFGYLNAAARSYYRDARNFESIFAADRYQIERFTLVAVRDRPLRGSVYFARETARFRDHAHDLDLSVTATVPVGVVAERGNWRIKDPGHPWRAFASDATATANGVHVTVKKVSFFRRRIETIVTFTNLGSAFVNVLPYGRSLLSDGAGNPYRILETRDWSLTDRTLFGGLRLAPNARYTGVLAFACDPLDNVQRTFTLRVAPLLVDGADAPFSIDVDGIRARVPGVDRAVAR